MSWLLGGSRDVFLDLSGERASAINPSGRAEQFNSVGVPDASELNLQGFPSDNCFGFAVGPGIVTRGNGPAVGQACYEQCVTLGVGLDVVPQGNACDGPQPLRG